MTRKDPKRNSMLYYFTLGVVVSLLAAAAMSQGQERGLIEAPQMLGPLQQL